MDRASGDLWLVDNEELQRLSPAGATRWRTTWTTTSTLDSKETLALDAQGTAYSCGAAGVLRAVSPAGRVLWQYQFRVPRYGFASPPAPALGPDGKLYVSTPHGLVVFAP